MSITNLTSPYSTPYQVSADDIDLIKIRSLETSPLTHEDLDDNFANLMNKVNALVDIIGGSSAAISVDGDGNVGIGTTNPSHNLTLGSPTSAGTTSTSLKIYRGADDAGQNLEMGYNHITVTRDVPLSSNQSTFSINQKGNDGERTAMLINSDGNVGIGTTSPSAKLTIEGEEVGTNLVANNNDACIRIRNKSDIDGNFAALDFHNSTNFITARVGAHFKDAGDRNTSLYFATRKNGGSLAQRMTINEDGNVGIGTTSPESVLEVQGKQAFADSASNLATSTTKSALRVKGSNNGSNSLWMGVETNNASPYIQGANGAGNTAIPVLINPFGGNVGIGTTSPKGKLDVSGLVSSSGMIRATGWFSGNNSDHGIGCEIGVATYDNNDTGFLMTYDRSSSSYRNTLIQSGDTWVHLKSVGESTLDLEAATINLRQRYNDTTSDATVNIMGKVGIGTTSPDETLHVSSAAGPLVAILEHTDGGSSELAFKDSQQQNDIRIGTADAGFRVFTADEERMRIDSDGKVGIGTTSPEVMLDVDGKIQIQSDQFWFKGENFRLIDRSSGDSVERMRIDSSGNVGIGTTSPSANLHVLKDVGNANVDGNFTLSKTGYTRSSSHPEGSGQFMTHKLSELTYDGFFSENGNNHLNDTVIGLDVNLNTNAGKQYAALFNGGNVGIGTTSPSATLDIQGTAKLNGNDLATVDQLGGGGIWAENANGAYYSGNVGIGTTNPNAPLEIKGSRPSIRLTDDDPAGSSVFEIVNNGNAFGLYDNANIGLGNILYIEGGTGATAGNIGIGTMSPSARLHITDAHGNGSTSASGQLELSNIHTNGGTWGIHTSADGWNIGGGGKLGFFADDNANQARMVITQAGKVGIGATSPESELHIKGDITFSGETTQNQGTRAEIVHTSGVDANGDEISNDGGLLFRSYDNSTAVDALAITHNGNVGIGTTDPSAKLDVIGRGKFDSLIGNNGLTLASNGTNNLNLYNGILGSTVELGISIASGGNVGIGTTSPTQPLEIKAVEGQFGCHVVDNQGISYGGLYVQSNGGTGSGLALYLKEPAGQTSARISADSVNPSYVKGKFGIGTTNPIFALDVSSNLSLTLGADELTGSARANNSNKSSRVGGVNYNNGNDPVNMMMHVSKATESLLYFGWGTSEMVCPTKIVFGTASNTNTSSANSTGNQRMIIDSNGDVLVKYDLHVAGTLSKASGTFKIDHPLPEKSETHHLVHSFIEGPQADNIYRGKVQLVAGKAEVNIDAVSGMTEGTFVALNRDIQTFTSNESDWDAVRGKVEGNKLIIECQNTESTATVSWLVIGERQDEHMLKSKITDENGKLIVEPLKPDPEPEYVEVEPVVEEASEEPVAEEAPVEEPQAESDPDIITKEDGKEYIRIGDKEYEVLGKNEDGSLLLDDDTTNNG